MDQSNQAQPPASTSRTLSPTSLHVRLLRHRGIQVDRSRMARKSTTQIPDSLRNSRFFKPNTFKPKVFNFHHLEFSSEADESKRMQFNEDNTQSEDNQNQNNGRSNDEPSNDRPSH